MTGNCLHCGAPIETRDAPNVEQRHYCDYKCRGAAQRARNKANGKTRYKPKPAKEERGPAGLHADWECEGCGGSVFAASKPDKCEHCGGGIFARIHQTQPGADLFQQVSASVRLIGDECRASREAMATFKHKRVRKLGRLLGQVQALADDMMRTLTAVENPDHVALEAQETR